MIIDYIQASHAMKDVTSTIDKDIFDLNGVGLLIIGAYACAQVQYELLDEIEREEWFSENTPCCNNREHIGWSCDVNGCYPF